MHIVMDNNIITSFEKFKLNESNTDDISFLTSEPTTTRKYKPKIHTSYKNKRINTPSSPEELDKLLLGKDLAILKKYKNKEQYIFGDIKQTCISSIDGKKCIPSLKVHDKKSGKELLHLTYLNGQLIDGNERIRYKFEPLREVDAKLLSYFIAYSKENE